jgi:nickel/cobalt transporter (NicO) family protein
MCARLLSAIRLRALLLIGIAVWTLFPSRTPSVAAHPLGNFTVNLYSHLTIDRNAVSILYVVDKAEIPTFQEFGATPPAGDAQTQYLDTTVPVLIGGLRLHIDDQPVSLDVAERVLSFPPGQGGLPTTRLKLRLVGRIASLAVGDERRVAYEDTNFGDRLGWREIVVVAGSGVRVAKSDVSSEDRSDALRAYPQDMLQSPPDQRRAQITVIGAAATTSVTGAANSQALAAPSTDRLTALIATEQLGRQSAWERSTPCRQGTVKPSSPRIWSARGVRRGTPCFWA